MKNLYFNSEGHNGDIHYCREYVRDIIRKTDYDNYYFLCENINNAKNLLKDIPELIFDKFNDEYNLNVLSTNPNYIYGHYILRVNDNDCYISLPINIDVMAVHFIYSNIYDELQITLEELSHYEPKIDYNYYNINNVNEYLKNNISNFKVLISNGPIRSYQSDDIDFSKIVDSLSEDFREVDFILTDKININKNNIFFTSDIIKNDGCDLMEISYLSTFCHIIIGRSSSPYTQTIVKENIRDVNKTIIFMTKALNSGIYFYNNPISKIWINNSEFNNVYNTIKNEINKKTDIDKLISIKKKKKKNRIDIKCLQYLDSKMEMFFYIHDIYEHMDRKKQDGNCYCYHRLTVTGSDSYWVIPYSGYDWKVKTKIRINYKNSVYVKVLY